MIDQKRIDSLKGTIDYYYWKKIPVARIWPRWPARSPHPAEKANQIDFARLMKIISKLPPDIVESYKLMAQGTPYTWRDLAISLSMKVPEWHNP